MPAQPNQAPVIVGKNISVGVSQSAAASSMIVSAIDPDQDAITQYAFYDSGSGGGHFVLGGVTQASGAWITVSAANLGTLSYVGGSAVGNEAVYIVASDGKTWSASSTVTVATTGTSTLPVVIGKNVNVNVSQSTLASTMIDSVTAPNNGTIVQYAFWDNGTGGGHFVLSGVTQAAGAWIVVSAANLANLSYVGGTGVGSETIYVEASTMTAWSSAYALTASTTGVNHAPVIAGQTVTVGKNQSIAASTMIKTVSDADGDTITQYAFWDNGAGGGHFVLSGVTQTSGQWIVVDASSLANLTYVGGSATGKESVYVEASDGKTWSATATLTASTKNIVVESAKLLTPSALTVSSQLSLSSGNVLTAATTAPLFNVNLFSSSTNHFASAT